MRVLKIIGGAIVVYAGVLIGLVAYNYPSQFHQVITFGDMATVMSLVVACAVFIVKGGNKVIGGIWEKK